MNEQEEKHYYDGYLVAAKWIRDRVRDGLSTEEAALEVERLVQRRREVSEAQPKEKR